MSVTLKTKNLYSQNTGREMNEKEYGSWKTVDFVVYKLLK